MKPKILYAFVAALIIIILIIVLVNILIGRENAKIQPVSQESKPQEVVSQAQSALSQIPATAVNRPAITVIKSLPGEKPASVAEETEKKIKKSQQSLSALPPQGPAVSGKRPEEVSNEPVSGVTKIGKYPSEEKKEEMNARGIVMY